MIPKLCQLPKDELEAKVESMWLDMVALSRQLFLLHDHIEDMESVARLGGRDAFAIKFSKDRLDAMEWFARTASGNAVELVEKFDELMDDSIDQSAPKQEDRAMNTKTECPVLPLAIEYEDLARQHEELEQSKSSADRRRAATIYQRMESLAEQASWLQPTSAQGAAFLTAQVSPLINIMDGCELDGHETGRLWGRIQRINYAVTDFLIANGGRLDEVTADRLHPARMRSVIFGEPETAEVA